MEDTKFKVSLDIPVSYAIYLLNMYKDHLAFNGICPDDFNSYIYYLLDLGVLAEENELYSNSAADAE